MAPFFTNPFFFFFNLKTWSHYVAHTGCSPTGLLPLLPECRHAGCVSPTPIMCWAGIPASDKKVSWSPSPVHTWFLPVTAHGGLTGHACCPSSSLSLFYWAGNKRPAEVPLCPWLKCAVAFTSGLCTYETVLSTFFLGIAPVYVRGSVPSLFWWY